ncbi:MAG: antitoxin component YwqK of YwqJK toxin-antitoxin module [Planctomycetota bacterium]|jgi:antitoxin component YwqK of YwqJK toxin-antitoxin module
MIAVWMLSALFISTQDGDQATVREKLGEGRTAVYQVQTMGTGENRRHGSFTLVGSEGEVLVNGEYTAGKKSGRWRFRYADGKALASGAYKDGKRMGEWTFSHANHENWAKGKYKRGEPTGSWKFWTDNGESDPVNSGKYEWVVNSRLAGGVTSEGLTLDEVSHGPWTFTWPNGQVQLEASFSRGERTGSWNFWHIDGSFDPLFESGDYGGNIFDAPMVRDPTEVEPSNEEDPADRFGSSLDLAQLKEWLAVDDVPAELHKLYEGCIRLEGAAYEQVIAELLTERKRVLPLVLEELIDLDYDKSEGRVRALLIMKKVTGRILGGHQFETRKGADSKAWRLAVLRLHSLSIITANNELYWSVDLPSRKPKDLQEPGPLLLKPPISAEMPAPLPGKSDVYRLRFTRRKGMDRKAGKALDEGLAWLVAHQDPSGKWDCDEFMKHNLAGEPSNGPGFAEHDVGVTGLALLALLADGHTPITGTYQDNVQRAVVWLSQKQNPKSGLIGSNIGMSFLYDHCIATEAICEAYALCGSAALRSVAERAVSYLDGARNSKEVWRYDVPPTGDNDTSMTGWAGLALVAARDAGLKIRWDDFRNINRWLEKMTAADYGRIGYRTKGSPSARVQGVNDQYPREHSEALTAIGLHCSYMLGGDPETSAVMQLYADLLLTVLPEWSKDGLSNDLYYWFHGTYAMHHMGGKYAKAWDRAILKAVLAGQERNGSWAPDGPWGMMGGRVYSTALMALTLEAPIRYTR